MRLWHRITANSSQSTKYDPIWVLAHCLRTYFITSTKFSIFPIMRSKSNVRVLCALTHSVGCYLFCAAIFFLVHFSFFHHRRHHCELVFVMPSFRLDSSVSLTASCVNNGSSRNVVLLFAAEILCSHTSNTYMRFGCTFEAFHACHLTRIKTLEEKIRAVFPWFIITCNKIKIKWSRSVFIDASDEKIMPTTNLTCAASK